MAGYILLDPAITDPEGFKECNHAIVKYQYARQDVSDHQEILREERSQKVVSPFL